VIGSSPNPGPAPVLGPFLDGTPPIGSLAGKLTRTGAINLELGCDEDCTAGAGGVVIAGRSRFKLRKAAAQIGGGGSTSLRLRPKGSGARLALRSLIGGGAAAKARISVTFVDRSGNAATERLVVKPKR
jgi:hypothetical protein